jgi:hypothetical protein
VLAHGGRPGAPKELWSRQADVLREYHRLGPEKTDVAIELPTGAGKTLVGCLIAEWRRRKNGERVAYVAPTRQLAGQAAAQARLYGVPAVDLTGSWRAWAPGEQVRFTQGEAVAFVTYSTVFNTNPHVSPQVLVLDDAHAAEGFVASNWSVSIRRGGQAYAEVLDVLAAAGALSADVVHRLRRDDPEAASGRGAVYLAGVAEVAAAAGELEKVLEDAASAGELSASAAFSLEMVTGSLPACMVYISRWELLIRPLIAPTRYHPAFADANQRVYMSATLGEGGELERAFGKRKIHRIPVPAGWESQGTGRKFVVFPDLLTGVGSEERLAKFSRRVITDFGKAVLITPSGRDRDRAVAAMVPKDMEVWEPEEYAADPGEFASSPDGVLALANRYDGIDLPDEMCRLVVLAGLPVGMHLQERFIHDGLGAVAVLTERIRTRLTQGAGRATRNSTDYAAVLMVGRELANFCAEADVQAATHPEFRAEIQFGLDNSRAVPAGDALANLAHFRAQDEDWREVEQDIIAARETLPPVSAPGTAELSAAVKYEIAAVEAAWQGDWGHAIEQARKAIDELAAGGEELRRYQALWHYLLASWAVIAARRGDEDHWQSVAAAHFSDARAAAAGTRWLAGPTTDASQLLTRSAQASEDLVDTQAVDAIAGSALRTGPVRRLTDLTRSVRDGLAQPGAPQFERALAGLGQLAGAEVLPRSGQDAEPDAVWVFGQDLWVALEAKSECVPGGQVAARDAREAGTHLNYAAATLGVDAPAGSFAVIISPHDDVHPAAARVAGPYVYLTTPAVISGIASRLTGAWDTVRTQTRGLDPEQAKPVISSVLRARRALPSQWLPSLTMRRVQDG